LKKNLGPKIIKDPTRKTAYQLHPKTLSSSKMKQASCEFLLEKCLVKLFKSGVARRPSLLQTNKGIKQSKNKKENKG